MTKLYTGQISISAFSFFGLWRPLTFNTKWTINLYQIYTYLMITSQATVVFTLLIYFKDVWNNAGNFTLNLLYFFSMLSMFIKQLTIVIKRNVVIDIQERLLDKVCQPRDSYEVKILQKQSQICRVNVIVFLVILNITILAAILTPLTKGSRSQKSLPLPAWIPYSLESKTTFYVTYLFQSFILTAAAWATASMEGLVLTYVLQICAQLELLFHRLNLLPHSTKNYGSYSDICVEETRFIADSVKHHIHIYSLENQINNLFAIVIFSQFFWSMISICTVIHQFTSLSNNATYSIVLFTSVSVSAQTFLYCFYGEMIIQKSTAVAQAIQEMDWTLLTNQTKRDLLIIMIRAARPIELHDSIVVVMSLKTFLKIAKSAYSAYNLMHNVL